MRTIDVLVDKVIYHEKASAYTVFSGIVLKKHTRKGGFSPTKETHIFVGYFFCIFPGDRFEIDGEETFSPKYGTRFVVAASRRQELATETEIRKFLKKNIKGMTDKRIDKVIDRYGLESLSCIRTDPHAYDFLGLTIDATDEIRSALLQNGLFEELLLFLQQKGIDCRYALPLFKKYGDKTVPVMQGNAYKPFLDNIYDFKVADRIFLESGHSESDPMRCTYVTLACLQNDAERNGNVFTRESRLRGKLKQFLTGKAKAPDKDGIPFLDGDITLALDELVRLNLIQLVQVPDDIYIYLSENYASERKIAECLQGFFTQPKRMSYQISDILAFIAQYEANYGITLAQRQKEAVVNALTSPISIISGGPGTGKTQTINTIMAAIKALTPDASIRACAPTGKAAIRITELTGVPASTIHMALKIGAFQEEVHGGELKCDFMFVDEFSMVDVQLCAKLFDAVNSTGRIIIVGDYNQLPSVGPGLVLRDFISCGAIRTTILNEIFRQKGGSKIVENAHRIITQTKDQPIHLCVSQKPGGDFYFIEEDDPREILRKVQASIRKARKDYQYTEEQIQVLSPVHFGDLGVDNLNYVLQQSTNPSTISIHYDEKEFRMHDKVIHTKNNYELDVFNGEVGFIKDIDYSADRAVLVEYPGHSLWYPYRALEELDLAYALTVHKLQGSEYPVIIMPVHELQGRGLSKNLIYTALTRAKKMVIVIGSKEAFSSGLRRETTMERESDLPRRIKEKLPESKLLAS